MPESLKIRTTPARRGSPDTKAATSLLRGAWEHPEVFLYDGLNRRPNIVSVGRVGRRAVVAAVIRERIEPAELDDNVYSAYTRAFLDVPYLEILAITTKSDHRRKGYGRQMVMSTLMLAKSVEFHRVQAWSSRDRLEFWGQCRFVQVPYGNGLRDVARETRTLEGDILPSIEVVDPVRGRLQDFASSQDLSVLARHLR